MWKTVEKGIKELNKEWPIKLLKSLAERAEKAKVFEQFLKISQTVRREGSFDDKVWALSLLKMVKKHISNACIDDPQEELDYLIEDIQEDIADQ